MRILAVEDEVILLKQLTSRIHEVLPDAEIMAFDNSGDTLDAISEKETDIAFLDIEIGDMNGVELAKRIKETNPHCDVVFCTGYSSYAADAFGLGASDYLLKPITREKIEHALSLLRHTDLSSDTAKGLYIRCFGEFEVFYQGEPLTSLTRRAKELMAYLVDKAGAVCSSSEISSDIFPNSSDSYIRVVKKDLSKALSDIGQEDILIKGWGMLGINREKVRCDYFDFLDGKVRARGLYKGEYMAQYNWAQDRNIL